MIFSPTSLISVIFFSSLFIAAVWGYLFFTDRMVYRATNLICILIGLILFRLALPLKFTFSIPWASKVIMPHFLEFLGLPLIMIGNQAVSISHLLLSIWIVGSMFKAIETLVSHLYFKTIIKQMPVLQDPTTDQIIKEISLAYEKPVPFQIRYSKQILTPILYGLKKPLIIVPRTDFSYREWYFILSHEIAHHYKRDLLIKALVQILTTIYWWNPFVYFLNHEINQMLEMRIDFLVTKDLNDHGKVDYLDCLLKVAKAASVNKSKMYFVPFNEGKASFLTQRFHLVLGQHQSTKSVDLKRLLLILPVVLLFYFAFFVVIEPQINDSRIASSELLEKASEYLHLYYDQIYMVAAEDH